jgi:hypothetical protein
LQGQCKKDLRLKYHDVVSPNSKLKNQIGGGVSSKLPILFSEASLIIAFWNGTARPKPSGGN